jgi:hypothetical protein
MKMWIFVLFVSMTVYSQQILTAGKNYKFTAPMVVFTVEEFEKMEAAWSDDSLNVEKIRLLQAKVEVMDSTEKALDDRVFLLDRQIVLQKGKLDLSVEREGLFDQKIKIYKGLYEDTDKALQRVRGKSGFFNNTFWFGFGTVTGVGLTYLGSKIVKNVD